MVLFSIPEMSQAVPEKELQYEPKSLVVLERVHDKGWPSNIAVENSRNQADWANRKVETIKSYRYCVAIENTDWPYYLSEKIWQAMRGGCVPVYGGSQGTIYEDFEPDTFIDINNYKSSDELFEHLDKIDVHTNPMHQ